MPLIEALAVITIFILQPVLIYLVLHCLTEVKAMQRSTHSIQYVPVDPKFETMTQDVKESLTKELFDNVN